MTSALQFAPWLRSHLHSGPPSASYSCYQLQVCLPGLGSLTASRMFGRRRQIRRLSTHLTEDFITLHCVWSVCVCECVVITSGPSTRLRLAFSVYNGLDQSRLSVQPVSGPAVWSYINCRQAVRMCVCDSVFSQSIILNRTRPEVVLLSKHF